MDELAIRRYGDPVLRAVGAPVKDFGPPLRALGAAMLAAMKTAKGIGLAAPQVGLSLQLFVMDVHDEEHLPVLDGGALGNVPPSTVVDCTEPEPRLVREGALPRAELRRAVGRLAP